MSVLATPPFLAFYDLNGNPLSGGKIFTYAAGTTTPKATFTDQSGLVSMPNPIILDSAGRATWWISGAYKYVITDSADNTIATTDNVTSFTTLTDQASAFFQSFSGNGSTTAFTLSTALGTEEKALMVFVDAGAGRGYDILAPTAFTVNGTALTFNVAPASGTNNIYVFAPSLLLGAASSAAAAAETSAANALASQVAAAASATTASTQAGIATTQAGLATTAATQANAIITRWNYSNTVSMADPSAGNFRFNNSTPNLSTAMAISATTANTGAPNFRLEMLTWDDSTSPVRGTLTFKSVTSPQNFLTFSITGALTDNTTWLQFTIANVASGGTITNGEAISIEFARAGNAGTSFSQTDITGQTQTAIALGDSIVYSDVSNGGALRRDTIQGIANLIPGGVALVSSGAITAVTAVNFTSIGSYENYRLVLTNMFRASAGTDVINLRFSTNNGSTYETTNYCGNLISNSAGTVITTSGGAGEILVGETTDAATQRCSCVIDIVGMNVSGFPTVFSQYTLYAASGSTANQRIATGGRQSAITANAFRILTGASSAMTGAFRLYGWN